MHARLGWIRIQYPEWSGNLMDYGVELGKAQDFMQNGHTTQAVQVLGKCAEMLHKDLYRQLRGVLPARELKKVASTEDEYEKNKSFSQFTFGQMIGLYRKANIPRLLETHLDMSLPTMKIVDPNYILRLRNQATHADVSISADDGWLYYWLITKLLKEAGKIPAAPKVRASRVEGPGDKPEPAHDVPAAAWAQYLAKLSKDLELEIQTFRVPVDIVPNRVAKYGSEPTEDPGKEERSPWEERALKSDKGLTVLLGEPGQGKTVSFTTLARRLVDNRSADSEAPIPIKVKLAYYEPSTHSLDGLLREQLLSCAADLSASEVPGVLARYSFTVLMDGLNEVTEQRSLMRELSSLVSAAPENQYFLSCRKTDYRTVQELLPPHESWYLQPFTEDDIKDFMHHVLEARPNREEEVKSLLSKKRVMEVLTTPFFLSLLADLDLAHSVTMRTMADWCQCFVDEFQRRELKTSPDQQGRVFPWLALEELAFEMQSLHQAHLSDSRFREISRDVWLNQLYGQETSTIYDDTLLSLQGSPLVTVQQGSVAFSHQLFRDFFAARALNKKADLTDSAAFARIVGNPKWDYTVVLLAGLLDDASQVLYNIIYEGSNYALAVRCLREAKRLDPNVLQSVIDWLLEGHQVDEVFDLGPMVASLGDEASEWRSAVTRRFVQAVLETEDHKWQVPMPAFPYILRPRQWVVPEDEALKAIESALVSSNEYARGNAVLLLLDVAEWDRLQTFANDPSPYVRRKLAEVTLWQRGEESMEDQVVETLRSLCDDPDLSVRKVVMEATHTWPKAIDIALMGLGDHETEVQQLALYELFVRWKEGEDKDTIKTQVPALLRNVIMGEALKDDEELVLDFLAELDTSESSNALLEGAYAGRVKPIFVASVLAERGDPRAVFATIIGILDDREYYFAERYWRTQTAEKLATLWEHPFELAWVEAILLDQPLNLAEDYSRLSKDWKTIRADPHQALEAFVETARKHDSALALFVQTLVTAIVHHATYDTEPGELLVAVLAHLISIDPDVLGDVLVPETMSITFSTPARESPYVHQVLDRYSILEQALSQD